MLPMLDVLLARLAETLGSSQDVVVATSGGPDSQALLYFASLADKAGVCRLRGAIGIDHGLRPEAKRELRLAKALAERLQTPFVSRSVDLAGAGNLMARARRRRLAALREEASRLGAGVILLGHTRDDLAETMMWHLLRGSAPVAMQAMPYRRGPWVRPLLSVWRGDILAALKQHQIAFAIDPSNASKDRMRGRMRQLVWPALETAFPAAKALFTQGLEVSREEHRLLAEDAAAWRRQAQRRFGGQPALSIRAVRQAPRVLWPRIVRSFLLRQHAAPRDVDIRALVRWVAAPERMRPGKRPRHYVMHGAQIGLSQSALWICAASELRPRRKQTRRSPKPAAAIELKDNDWQRCGPLRVRATHLPSLGSTPAVRRKTLTQLGALAPRRAMTVAFARQRLHVALFLRPAEMTEKLDAFGATGRVQVSKLLQGVKLPWAWRPHWPVVAAGEEVVWLVGVRRGKQATIDVSEDGPVTLLQAEWCRQVQQP